MARLTKEQTLAKLAAKSEAIKLQLAAEANPDLKWLIQTERKLRRLSDAYTSQEMFGAAQMLVDVISDMAAGKLKSGEQAEMFPSGT